MYGNIGAAYSLSSFRFQRFFLLVLLRFYEGTALNSGQRLDNVCRTHLVQASGQLVLQRNIIFPVSVDARVPPVEEDLGGWCREPQQGELNLDVSSLSRGLGTG